MKVKALVAGMALVLGANGAHAAIATGTSGPGELFLSVWDKTAQQSYSQDLNVDMFRFLTDPSYAFYKGNTWSIALDSVWTQFHNPANAGQTVYNVAATDQTLAKFENLDPTWGYLTSFKMANPVPTPAGNVAVVQGPNGVISARAAGYNANPADAETYLPSSPAYYGNGWNNDFGLQVPSSQSNEGKLGDYLDVWLHGISSTLGQDEFENPIQLDRFEKMPYQFQLTATELKYAPIPLPAAAWLMGPALMTLIATARRRSVLRG